jgi:membrane fusion protein, multidrug efflux system
MNQNETTVPANRIAIPIVIGVILMAVLAVFVMGSRKANGKTVDASASATKNKKNGEKEKEKVPVPVEVVSASLGSISSYLNASANLVSEFEVKVLAETEGRITDLLVDEGQRVRKGQPLVIINRDDAIIAINKAQVRADNARVTFNRAKGMSETGLMSQSDFDKTNLDLKVAEQELAEAKWRLEKTTVRAPFDGRVTERVVNAGQHVRPAEVLFTIAYFDTLITRIFVPEKEAMGLTAGREVKLRLRADPNVVFAGRIRQISPVVDTATGTVKLTIDAVKPPALARPGAFVNVDIVRDTKSGALIVPRESVVREVRQAHVFIVEGQVAVKREVTIGLEENGHVEITSGIKPGEKVIVAGQGSLKDGSTVKITPAA